MHEWLSTWEAQELKTKTKLCFSYFSITIFASLSNSSKPNGPAFYHKIESHFNERIVVISSEWNENSGNVLVKISKQQISHKWKGDRKTMCIVVINPMMHCFYIMRVSYIHFTNLSLMLFSHAIYLFKYLWTKKLLFTFLMTWKQTK